MLLLEMCNRKNVVTVLTLMITYYAVNESFHESFYDLFV